MLYYKKVKLINNLTIIINLVFILFINLNGIAEIRHFKNKTFCFKK